MSTFVKLLLALAVILIFAGFAAFFGIFFYVVSNAPPNVGIEYFQRFSDVMNLLGGLYTVYCAAVMLVFILHAVRNPNLEASGMRTTWILVLIILGPWAMPFYWFLHIWRDGSPLRKRSVLNLS